MYYYNETLGKKRTAARGWVTREAKDLQDLANQSTINIVELGTALESYSKRLDALDEIQAEYEVELDPAELDKDLDEAALFRKRSLVPLVLAREKLQVLQKSDDDTTSMGSGGSVAAKARLPKLELPKFHGEVTQWQSFWDQFTSHIGNTDMPDISKFSYLLSLLEGEAKVCVQGLSHTAVNYKTACDLLEERFGRKERIIFHHVQALLSGSVPVKSKGSKYVSSLWGLRDEFLSHIRSLEALGVSGKQCETFLTPIILSRLPNDIRLEWARKGAGRESDLEWLLTFLQDEIKNIERSETFKDVSSRKPESPGMPEQRKSKHSGSRDYTGRESSASALHVATSEVDKQSCVFCNKRHKAENCFELLKLSGQDRAHKIKFAGVCFKCLGKGHLAKGCLAKCSKCSGSHNAIMCGIKLVSTKNVTEGSAKTTSAGTVVTALATVSGPIAGRSARRS